MEDIIGRKLQIKDTVKLKDNRNATRILVGVIILTLVVGVTIFAVVKTVDTVEIETSQGPVKGFIDVTVNGKQFLAFKGIPYAKPPVGSLRFKVSF